MMSSEEEGKTVDLGAVEERPQQRRRRYLRWSFYLIVLLPGIAVSIYYGLIASDRYASSAGFVVRGSDTLSGIDGIGAITGLATVGSTTSDSYVVLEYLTSRDLVESLVSEIEVDSLYLGRHIDFVARMPPALPIEDMVEYWTNMIETTFDPTSGIITFEVQAFAADDALRISEAVLRNIDRLVNNLSDQARRDAVKFANLEVERAETRLADNRLALSAFREAQKMIDPAAIAALDVEVLGQLETELTALQARKAALGKSVDKESPTIRALKRQEEAIRSQIQKRRAAIGKNSGAGGAVVPGLLAEYEALLVEKEFAQQTYTAALVALQQARSVAAGEQRYLAVYNSPRLPEDAIYPERILNVFLAWLLFAIFWSVGVLIAYSIRDHLS